LLSTGLTVFAGDREEEAGERLSARQVLEFLEENGLDHIKREFNELREDGREEFEEFVEDLSGHIQEIRWLKKKHPEVAEALLKAEKLEAKSHDLAEAIEDTEDKGERKALQKELRSVLSEIFDARMVEGKYELKALESEVAELRDQIKDREANKARIIEARVLEMTGDEHLDWW